MSVNWHLWCPLRHLWEKYTVFIWSWSLLYSRIHFLSSPSSSLFFPFLIHLKCLLMKAGTPFSSWHLDASVEVQLLNFPPVGPSCYNCMPEESLLIKTDRPHRSEAARWGFITWVIRTSDLRDIGNAICRYSHSYLRHFSDTCLWAPRLPLGGGSAMGRVVA